MYVHNLLCFTLGLGEFNFTFGDRFIEYIDGDIIDLVLQSTLLAHVQSDTLLFHRSTPVTLMKASRRLRTEWHMAFLKFQSIFQPIFLEGTYVTLTLARTSVYVGI